MKLIGYIISLFKRKTKKSTPLYTKVDPIKWRPSDNYNF
jgi:hypothetical protein